MEMMCFQSYWFQLKNGTPVYEKRFPFSENLNKRYCIGNVQTYEKYEYGHLGC